ncbi:MAG: ribosome biogenesis GTP-binding protein YihA/YsxC [Rickettsiales bacterium]|jgi:GTP-binding protein|nr:ribosome biogenesis GTP-binding protein YihA/YsxC [Rickettsiales bacterium]
MTKESDNFFKNNKPIFITGAVRETDLPKNDFTEFAFIGRSNVGKSSLINAITNSNIAIVSKTPGRTKELNFFQMANKLTIVDMPGYGYAKANKKQVENWNDLIIQYLLYRRNLKRVFLLIDSRHGVKENDEQVMSVLDKSAILYQIILTKIDEIKPDDLELNIFNIKEIFKKHPALFGDILCASSKYKIGLEQIRKVMFE